MIGIDLDNTIIDYDEALHAIAVREGMIPEGVPAEKTRVRDYLRSQPGGEERWRLLQALAYGREIDRAKVMPGALEFVKECRARGVPVFIVSHKSERATADPDGPNLRQSAIRWLEARGFFGEETGLSPERVHFGGTRAEKVALIGRLGCTEFIDDLPETFEEPGFPVRTRKLLFSRDADQTGATGVHKCGSWTDFRTDRKSDCASAGALAAVAGFLGPSRPMRAVKGGRNSRVYQVSAGDRQYALKEYFQPAGDERDRMRTEFEAVTLMRSAGIAVVPAAVHLDAEHHCAFYEWIDGSKVSAENVGDSEVDEAVAFLSSLREVAVSSARSWRRPASEARFSIAEIIQNVEQRLAALERAPDAKDDTSPFSIFMRTQLRPFAISVMAQARRDADSGPGYNESLPDASRTLSPSDFGFHNALRTARGLTFVDFEYFGWDDPAKTICDFVLHPAMALSVAHKRRFVAGMFAALSDMPQLPDRVAAVYPLFGLKWVLIILNEFLPEHLERRDFAGLLGARKEKLLSAQLTKAAALLNSLDATRGTFPYV